MKLMSVNEPRYISVNLKYKVQKEVQKEVQMPDFIADHIQRNKEKI